MATNPPSLLTGQVAIITGGAGAIGAETARVFIQHGARVVFVDIRPASSAEGLLKELGPKAHYEECDVTDEESVSRVWEKAFSLEGRLDVVFNNAGVIGPIGTIDALSMTEFDKCIAVNLRAMVLGIKHGARLMKPAKKGSIVCTASTASLVGGLGPLVYSVSKGAIVALVNNAAAELGEHGIRVNAVSPAGIASSLTAEGVSLAFGAPTDVQSLQTQLENAPRRMLPSRVLTTTDVANAVLYFASDLGVYINGQNLAVDGGDTLTKTSGIPWRGGGGDHSKYYE